MCYPRIRKLAGAPQHRAIYRKPSAQLRGNSREPKDSQSEKRARVYWVYPRSGKESGRWQAEAPRSRHEKTGVSKK
jgi:hypothetical protein